MKKAILATLMAGLMIVTVFGAMSVNAICVEKQEVNEGTSITINDGRATIWGVVKNRFGFGCSSANVMFCVGPDPENSEYYKTIIVSLGGYYETEVDADEQGTTYQVQAFTIRIGGGGDESQWEEVTVFPGQEYELPDLILPHTPRSKQQSNQNSQGSQQSTNPLFFQILQRLLNTR